MDPFVFVPECESTQVLAREWIESASAARICGFRTNNQLKGKGRTGAWLNPVVADDAALLCSVAIRGPFSLDVLADLPRKVSQLAIECLDQRLRFKACDDSGIVFSAPNDLEISGRKVGGVLIDSRSTEASVDWLIVGVGVNLVGPRFSIVTVDATTIHAELGIALSAGLLATDLVHGLRSLVSGFS